MFSSLEEMIEAGWFWSSSDLLYQSKSQIGFASWAPPAPLGWINGLMSGKVMWSAVWKGLDTTVALAFLYLIRCSIHGAAMKKNVRNLQRKARKESTVSPVPSPGRRQIQHRRKFSEALDIENLTAAFASGVPAERLEKAKPTTLSLKDILIQYGFSQFICAAVGSFPVTPSVAASSTMFVVSIQKDSYCPMFSCGSCAHA